MMSWEIKQQNQVLVTILHTDNVVLAWALGLRNLIIPGQILPLAGMPFDMARNMGCQKTLEMGFEWSMHLDSDTIPPRDAILRLLAHKKPVISGLYCRRSPPHGVPVMIKNGTWVVNYLPNSIVDVDLVGAGCLLIHRSVLEALPPSDANRGKRWFDWRVDMAGLPGVEPGDNLSEDFSFCRSVKKKLGIPILVDTSIQCRHVGLAESTYNSFVPLDTMASLNT
jgi:hypothetical protein